MMPQHILQHVPLLLFVSHCCGAGCGQPLGDAHPAPHGLAWHAASLCAWVTFYVRQQRQGLKAQDGLQALLWQ